MSTRKVVRVLIQRPSDGRILVVDRKYVTNHTVTLPGGKVEESDASYIDALIRELEEETDYSITDKSCIIQLTDEISLIPWGFEKELIVYYLTDFTKLGKSRLVPEELHQRWMTPDEYLANENIREVGEITLSKLNQFLCYQTQNTLHEG